MDGNINDITNYYGTSESEAEENKFFKIEKEIKIEAFATENTTMDEDEEEDVKPSMSNIEDCSREIKKEDQSFDEISVSDYSDCESEEGENDVKKKLIKAIKSRPALYDDNYKINNLEDKEAISEEISKDLDTTEYSTPNLSQIDGNINHATNNHGMSEPETNENEFFKIEKELIIEAFVTENTTIDDYEEEDIKPFTSDIKDGSMEIREDQNSDEMSVSDLSDDKVEDTNNSQAKEVLWKDVSKELNKTVDFCKTNWVYLTNRYAGIVQNRITKGICHSQWMYYDDMLFYMPFCSKEVAKIINNEDEQFNRRIIELVRDKYPEVYDTNHPEFSRILAWYKIAEDMNSSADKCRKIWNDLRFVFSSQWSSRNNGKKCWKFPFENLMQFLVPFIGIAAIPSNRKPKEIRNNEVFKRKLAKIIQEYPLVYTQLNLNNIERLAVWKEIAEKMGEDVNKCRTTWRILRGRYSEAIRRRKLGQVVTWKYEKDLEFLLPCLIKGSLKPEQITEKQSEKSNFRFQLIKIVQKYPILYDFEHLGCNRTKQGHVWKQIAEDMKKPRLFCQNIWRDLKATFGKLIINKMKGENKTWPYEEAMQFMWPYMKFTRMLKTKNNDNNADAQQEEANFAETHENMAIEIQYSENYGDNTQENSETADKDAFLQNVEFVRLFLETVKKYPQLYCHYNEQHWLPREEYELTWRVVGKEVNWTASECVRAWRRLKQIYRKKDVKRNTEMEKWIYEDDLAFAKTFILSRDYPKQKRHDEDELKPYLETDNKKAVIKTEEGSEDCHLNEIECFKKKLIQVVKKYPPVYDFDHEDYCRRSWKSLWENIAKEMNSTVTKCRDTWGLLRASYRNVLKGRTTVNYRKTKFEDDMEFLEPFLIKKIVDKDARNVNDYRLKLIEMIKEYPELYDPNYITSKKGSFQQKRKLWNKIAKEVQCKVETCRYDWRQLKRTLKDAYTKRSSNPATWEFHEKMKFMIPFIEGLEHLNCEAQGVNALNELDVFSQNLMIKKIVDIDEKNVNDYRFKLIEMIKGYPELYDPNYITSQKGSVQQKRILWNKIAKEIRCKVETCRYDWRQLKRTLKDAYTTRSSNPATWEFHEKMKFMIPFIEGLEHLNSETQGANALYEHDVFSQNLMIKKIVDIDEKNVNDYRFKLIEMIKEYPELYDPNYITSKKGSVQQKRILWNKIAEEVRCKVETCRHDWRQLKRTLKDAYTKRSSNPATWKFHEKMKFMIPFIEGLEHFKCEIQGVKEIDNFSQKLILAIEKHPVLYDEAYRDYMQAIETWKTVSNELNSTVKKCQMHWRCLKVFYIEFLQQKLKKSKTTWNYESLMEFMKPHIINKVKTPEVKIVTDDNELEKFKRNLIKVVKKYPELYDFEHVRYGRNRTLIEPTWKKIAQELGRPVHECRVVWNNMKIYYRKLLKGETYNKQKWRFQDDMQFMLPYISTLNTSEKDFKNAHKEPNFTQRLIDLLKKKYTEPYKIDCSTWENIARELNTTAEECEKTWTTLKQTYTILQEGKTSSCGVGVKWRYEESMKFLNLHLPQPGETHNVSDEEYKEKSISLIEDDQYQENEKFNYGQKRVYIDYGGPSTSKAQKTDYNGGIHK